MKDFKIVIMTLISATLFFAGCKKAVPESEQNTMLYSENINNLKKSEPLSLTFGDDDVVDKVIWTITPSTGTSINTIANNAYITFTTAGTYKVTATMGKVYAVYNVTVDDVDYKPNYGSAFSMTAPKFVGIAQNEPIVFSVHNAAAGNSIGWALFTTVPYTISRDIANKTATIIFTGNGAATVYADDGVATTRRTVWIGNSTNTNQVYNNFILGDKLQLTPSVEMIGGIKKLVITAKTNRKYFCDTDKILSFSINSELAIDYSAVAISSQICSVRSVASTVNSFKNIAQGTHSFTINFANKTYSGTVSMDVNGKYKFNWPDASVVSILPLEVQ